MEGASTGKPSAVEEEKAGTHPYPWCHNSFCPSYTPSHSVSVSLSMRSFWVVSVIRNSRSFAEILFLLLSSWTERPTPEFFLTMKTLILCSPCDFIWIISLSFCCKTSICDWICSCWERVVLASCAWSPPDLVMPSWSLGMVGESLCHY